MEVEKNHNTDDEEDEEDDRVDYVHRLARYHNATKDFYFPRTTKYEPRKIMRTMKTSLGDDVTDLIHAIATKLTLTTLTYCRWLNLIITAARHHSLKNHQSK